ncbi:MAG TPA: hypothetical protein VFN95_00910 [Flavitalea sp.]|nr:hypothetical protein [Flavitalea sp.]
MKRSTSWDWVENGNEIPLNLIGFLRIFIQAIFASFILYACSGPSPGGDTPKVTETLSVKAPPASVVQAIQNKFPGAVSYKEGIDSLVNHLKRFGIQANKMLWGQSTCVDDITNTKDKLMPQIKGPFNFGGLAGLPFTGITGLDAFVHHVPEDGTAILFVAPHIGYNEKEGWGKILRHDQHHTSSCCGALVAALATLQKGELKPKVPAQEDYQEGMIVQLAFAHHSEILTSSEPILSFTQLTYREAIRQMSYYASKVKERHFKYAVIVGGIIINTDYMFTDYLWIETVSVLDIQKNTFVEGKKLFPDPERD